MKHISKMIGVAAMTLLFTGCSLFKQMHGTYESQAVIPFRRSATIFRMTSPTRTTRMSRTRMVPALALSQVIENTFFRFSV